MVILEHADWSAWLDLTRPEAELLQPLPAGSLTVEQVRSLSFPCCCWRGAGGTGHLGQEFWHSDEFGKMAMRPT